MLKVQNLINKDGQMLSDHVEISRQFLRSVRIDTDFGRDDALNGYVFQRTTRALLENMSNQINSTKQRAFTWTGPYGGGKSSLALVLCSLVAPNRTIRVKARKILNLTEGSSVLTAFATDSDGWLVLPVVGRRSSITSAIEDCINSIIKSDSQGIARSRSSKKIDVVSKLVELANAREESGVLLVIDELGKFLESSAQSGDDVYFYQELAEAASRCKGKLVIVGVLHQSFEQYAARLGREARDEWAKVQGRFIDIPLITGTDEVIELVSRAITIKNDFDHINSKKIVDEVVQSIKNRRPGIPEDLAEALFACWPLHPITATLLGPISKRRFAQNERSTFGFLASREPIGFSEFLDSEPASALSMYGPSRYWDYLRANLEPAILISQDGHRWAAGAEAVERAESRGTKIHADITKTIALIELFSTGSGLAADEKILKNALENVSMDEISAALRDLESWSIVIFRKHLDVWGVYSGSDFDIDAAVVKSRSEVDTSKLKRISELSDLYPVIAKRLYQQRGTMRWFSRAIVTGTEVETYSANYAPAAGSCGEFVLVLPSGDHSKKALESAVAQASCQNVAGALVMGIPRNSGTLMELNAELCALEHVRAHRPELEGDGVARREINARINAAKSQLEEQLRDSFSLATWFYEGEKIIEDARKGLSSIASRIASDLYWAAPHISSELVNRDNVSSNGKAAQRDLMHRMVNFPDKKNLGYDAYPADAGLYYTVVSAAGLHREVDGNWRFVEPDAGLRGQTFQNFWQSTTKIFATSDQTTTLRELYLVWADRPLGLRTGVMPILALAYFMAHRHNLAMYIDGVFCPELTDANIDEWLQDPRRISFRYVQIGDHRRDVLEGLSNELSLRLGKSVSSDPLDSARGLVSFVFSLPNWTRRTDSLSQVTKDVRALLLKAHDPHKVLFSDLPALFDSDEGEVLVAKIVAVMEELADAYKMMLNGVEQKIFKALDHASSLTYLQERGRAIKGVTGDFMLDAFATRLSSYDGSISAIEGLVALASGKPARDCVDRDVDAAVLKLAGWSTEFRNAETLASLQGRPENRRAFGVIFGAAGGRSISNSFNVDIADATAIEILAKKFLSLFEQQNLKPEIFLAALAEAGAHIVENKNFEDVK